MRWVKRGAIAVRAFRPPGAPQRTRQPRVRPRRRSEVKLRERSRTAALPRETCSMICALVFNMIGLIAARQRKGKLCGLEFSWNGGTPLAIEGFHDPQGGSPSPA